MHDEAEARHLESYEAMRSRMAAAAVSAEALADELITDAWKRLIGPAWRLVRALIAYRAEASDLFPGGGEHVFGTLADVAALAGVSERTAQRWLAPSYRGAAWLRCWVSWRTWYTSRGDGGTCRGGTVFRVSLAPRPTHDLTCAPRPTLAALRAKWRLASELPGEREEGVGHARSLNRHRTAANRTFREDAGGREVSLKAEGRDVLVLENPTDPLSSNSRHPRPTAASVRAAEAWAKAELVAERLGDRHSTAFWCKAFRAAARGDGPGEAAIWRAVGLALETRSAGTLRRSPGAYAVGVLRQTGGLA